EDSGSFVSATDGERVYQIVHGRKEFVHGEFPERGYLLRGGSELVMQEFGDDNPFGRELQGKFRYERQESVGDVLCDVIYVEYKTPGEHARFFFGADGLPRRVERMSYMFPDLPPDGRLKKTLTLTELDIAPQLAAADFRLTLPEGYEEFELQPRAPLLAAGTVAPDWSLQTPDGRTVSLTSLRGNVVLMDFWATWCVPCKMAMPGIQKLHEHFEGKPVTVVGVNCQDADGDPAAYMAKKNYTYTLVMNGDRVSEAYSVMGLPTVYVIDTEGKVAHTTVGAGGEEKLIDIVQGLLPTDRTALADPDA
ncbi:MAG: redoxin domain-containing protein, partial [Planctomycetes bacterium]|nr:redoxin domain-containing protein [Planctomycetota bacterium]